MYSSSLLPVGSLKRIVYADKRHFDFFKMNTFRHHKLSDLYTVPAAQGDTDTAAGTFFRVYFHT